MELISELRRRNVLRMAMLYAIAAWLIMQVTEVLMSVVALPAWVGRATFVVLAVGFPIALIFSWFYEITPEGISLEKDVDRADSITNVTGRRLDFIVISLLCAAVILFAYDKWWVPGPPEPQSIAVLPFTNMSTAEDSEYFSDGLTEEIQSLLVRLNEFRVVALSSTYQLKGTTLDIPTVARRLDVDVILQGGVRRSSDQVRITARLIDGNDGSEIWSDSYDRRLADVFAIQESIARKVASALHIILPVSVERRLANLGTQSVEAYDLYLRAIDFLRQPKDEATLSRSESYVQQAIAIDPNFAKAHAAMCEAHLARYEMSRDTQHFEGAERACHRALTRDTTAIEVHLALGRLYYSSGQYDESIHEFEQALAINSNSADAYIGLGKTFTKQSRPAEAEANLRRAIASDASYWASFNEMGNFLFAAGRFGEAAAFFRDFARRSEDNATAYNNLGAANYLAGDFSAAAEAYERSLAIKPTRSAHSNTGTMYFYLGQFEKAAEQYATAVELAPMDHRFWGNLADAYYYSDGLKSAAEVVYKKAIEIGEERLKVNPSDMKTVGDVAYYYARIGYEAKAREMSAAAMAAAPDHMYVHYYGALLYAHFGDVEQALNALERAVELDYQREMLKIDPGLKPLWEEARFKRLVTKSGR